MCISELWPHGTHWSTSWKALQTGHTPQELQCWRCLRPCHLVWPLSNSLMSLQLPVFTLLLTYSLWTRCSLAATHWQVPWSVIFTGSVHNVMAIWCKGTLPHLCVLYCLKYDMRSAWLWLFPDVGNTWITFLHFALHHLHYQLGSMALACPFVNPRSVLHILRVTYIYTREWRKPTPHTLIGLTGHLCVSVNTAIHIAFSNLSYRHPPSFPVWHLAVCVLRWNIYSRLVSNLRLWMLRSAFPSMWTHKPVEYACAEYTISSYI